MLRSIAKKNRFIWNRYPGGHQRDWERTLRVMWTESQLGILNTQCTRVKVFHTGDKRSAKLLFSSSFICAYGAARSYNLYDGRNCVIPCFSVNSLLNVLFYYKFKLLQAHAQSLLSAFNIQRLPKIFIHHCICYIYTHYILENFTKFY